MVCLLYLVRYLLKHLRDTLFRTRLRRGGCRTCRGGRGCCPPTSRHCCRHRGQGVFIVIITITATIVIIIVITAIITITIITTTTNIIVRVAYLHTVIDDVAAAVGRFPAKTAAAATSNCAAAAAALARE